MKFLFSIILLFLIALKCNSQECVSYNFDVKFDVTEKKIKVNGDVLIDFQGQDSIALVLWKNSAIHSISINKTSAIYHFDTISKSPVRYIPKGGNLIIFDPQKNKGIQKVTFNYTCDMHNVDSWATSFSENWIEVNYYCAWFPVNLKSNKFTSRFNISIDKEFKVTGSGKVEKKGKRWQMLQSWESFDNVIIASKNIETRKLHEESTHIETNFIGLNKIAADSVIGECKYAFNLYQQLFGKKDSAYFKFIIGPYSDGGGYSRKNFVSWRSNTFSMKTMRGIGHELAHFWWNSANTTTWEDWLNESFAEYSMLVYIRARFGTEVFNKRINEYKQSTVEIPPIWDLYRDDPRAYEVLYRKGALILYEFEQKAGQNQFYMFLKKVATNKIDTTSKFLELVETEFSKDMRQWIEDKLRNA